MPPTHRRQPPPPPSQQQPPLHADSAGTGSGADASKSTIRARHPAAAAAAAVPSVVAAAIPSSSSSRIIVRNLPKHITIQRFRDHFAARGGTVTDASLAHAPDGTFRRFGFIGFRSAKEARAAVKFFDQTFLDTSRLQVDFARSLHDQAAAAAAAGPGGDSAAARPWSRYSEGSSAHRRDEEKAKAEELRRKEREERAAQHRAEVARDREHKQSLLQSLYADRSDPKLKEFLEVMRPRAAARARTWANDDALGSSSSPPTPASTAAPAAKKLEVLAVPNKKPGGQGLLVTRAHVKFAGDDDDEDDDLYEDLASAPAPNAPPPAEPHTDAVIPAPEKAAVLDSAVSDLDYMKSRMRADLDDDGEDGDGDIDHDRGQDDIDDDDEDEDHAADAGNGDAAGNDHQTLPNPPIGPGAGSDTAPTATAAVTSAHPGAWTPAKLTEAVPERARLKAAEEGAVAGPSAAHDVPSADTIADTGRLFVRNLPYLCEVADLEKLFGQFGQLTEVHMPIDRDTGRPKGIAFVLFMLPEHAVAAYAALDGRIFQGRLLNVLPARERRVMDDELDEGGDGKAGASYKKKAEAKRKRDAGKDRFAWNSLFMNSDAVVEAMARKLGVTKADILDPTSQNLAVRLAVAETDIIAETKDYLESEGLNLAAFEPPPATASSAAAAAAKTRSKTAIIVKNIPASTTRDDLEAAFAAHGALARVLLPPARTLAIVEFCHENDAKVAFRRLAYSMFAGRPLFLEFAPALAFEGPPPKPLPRPAAAIAAAKIPPAPAAVAAAHPAGLDLDDDDGSDGDGGMQPVASSANVLDPAARPSAAAATASGADDAPSAAGAVPTLFIKNLNFATTDDALRRFLDATLGPSPTAPGAPSAVRSVRIARKPDPKRPAGGGGSSLSMGFGFVEFASRDDAVRAAAVLQGLRLDGHELAVAFAARGRSRGGNSGTGAAAAAADAAADDADTGTKIIVRNVPFEATKKDIRLLFASVATPKSVRLPRKFDGAHRGFGFVDFPTRQDARAAFRALASTHLYGRHLVLEWAGAAAAAADDAGGVDAAAARRRKAATADDVARLRARTARSYFSGEDGLPAAK
ncbi:hypothetical protein HK405_006629, partial [Cladochytrium tenue]